MNQNEINGCGVVCSMKGWLACLAGGHGLIPGVEPKLKLELPLSYWRRGQCVPLADLRFYKHLVL